MHAARDEPLVCSIEGCRNDANVPGSARGWCRAHYRRWQKYGDPEEPMRRMDYLGALCTEPDCEKKAYGNGLCESHNATEKRRNDPGRQKLRNLAFKERFRAKQELLMGRPRPSLCELCGEVPTPVYNRDGICFDHDHLTGKPRGWLCDRCNRILGMVYDDPGLLRALASYLERHADGEAYDEAA